jgi:co-chaperonin GroES (HSP10)
MSENFLIPPLGRLLVKEIELESRTSGGIILTGESDPENKAKYGEIISNGILVNESHEDSRYQVGNKVYFGKHAGARLNFQGRDLISLKDLEIVAIEVVN